MKRFILTAMVIFGLIGTETISASSKVYGNLCQSGTTVSTSTLLNGRPSDHVSYMGMAYLNLGWFWLFSPVTPFGLPYYGIRTSHGAFFPKSGIYFGGSVEYLMGTNILNINPHLRYNYCTDNKVSGYVGADGGPTLAIQANQSPGFAWNAGLEVGLMVNFSKVSLDIGLRASTIFQKPHISQNFLFTPLHIGIVF